MENLPPAYWFFGLSGSGKTTISQLLFNHLKERSLAYPIELMDGDNLRASIPYKFGYSTWERSLGLNVAVTTAHYLRKYGVCCVLASILFTEEHRGYVKKILPGVIDIYCDSDIQTCVKRDPKGVYMKNIDKVDPSLVGIDIPFESPDYPSIRLDTQNFSIEETWNYLLRKLDKINTFKNYRKINE